MQFWNGWSEQGMRRYPEFIAHFLNGAWTRDAQGLWAGIQSEPQETRDAVIPEMLDFLKTLVDQWIESGKNEAEFGIEDPWKRNIQWTSPAYHNPISSLLLLYAENNPRVPSIDSDNRMRIDILPRPFDAKHPLGWAQDRAVFEFVMLLDSPARECLSRCDACSTYYVRARAPRKDRPIKRGTFCGNCRNKGGIRRMADRRNQKQKERIGLAADVWPKFNSSRRHGKRSEWVARQVTARMPNGESIQANWVTRHQSEIEAEVERRKYA